MPETEKRKVVIIGSGCAGHTAALYAARSGLEPLCFEGMMPGGLLTITTDVENYPGFPEGIMGPDLMEAMKAQAERFGTEYIFDRVTEIDFSGPPHRVASPGREVMADTVIVSTGSSPRLLGLDGENRLMGHGLSTCATCDGAFFRDQEMVIVGGGDSAMEEAIFLTRFATKVTVIHRRDALRASPIMADRALAHEKIEFLWDTVLTGYMEEEGKITGVGIHNVKNGEAGEIHAGAVFLALGHTPNTELFEGVLELDDSGLIRTRPDSPCTSVPGVYAAGDVQDPHWRQAVTAAGSGCAAALEAEAFLSGGHRGPVFED